MAFVAFNKAFFLIVLLFVAGTVQAQNPAPPPAQGNAPPKESSSNGVYTGRDVFVPEPPERKEPEPQATSFSDGFLRNTRRNIGLSVSVSEAYTPNVFSSSKAKEGASFTSILPQMYGNFQKKKLNFRLTYGIAFNRYNNGPDELNRLSQNGSTGFDYTISRRKTTIHFSDYFNSAYHDPSFLGSTDAVINRLDVYPQIYVDQRRETQNLAAIALSYNVTKKNTISVSVNDNLLHYSGGDFRIPHRVAVVFGTDFRITKRVSLTAQYSHYLNTADGRAN